LARDDVRVTSREAMNQDYSDFITIATARHKYCNPLEATV
jgi:hypothetical protein